MKSRLSHWTFPLVSLASIACSSSSGEGTVTVTAYGEAFIEEGVPAAEMDDAWAVEFDRFDVSIEEVSLGGETLSDIDVVDLTRASSGEGQELGTLLVPAGDHTNSSFSITRVELAGEATKGGETKSFHWVFEQSTDYDECETTTEVSAEASATFQITVHADHLFYDSLVSEEPQLLFGPLAASDANEDGEITQEELAATDIGSYDPGSEDGIDDLWTFLNAQVRTLGHVDGEGHCHAQASD